MNSKLKIGIVVTVIAIIAGVAFSKNWMNNGAPSTTPESTSAGTPDVASEVLPNPPTTTSLGNTIPAIVLQSLSIDKNTKAEQSYALDYSNGQKQTTTVFRSPMTAKENFSIYLASIIKDGWIITSKQDSDPVYLINGSKEGMDISVSLLPPLPPANSTSGSQVAVSVIKK